MPTASDIYLETMLRTATPQRLRLLVIGAVLRHLHRVRADWEAGRMVEGCEWLSRVRECLAELLSGIRPDSSELAGQVQALYLWTIERATELERTRDFATLNQLALLLTEEQETWAAVCEQGTPGEPVVSSKPSISTIDPPRTGVPAPLAGAPRRSTMTFEA